MNRTTKARLQRDMRIRMQWRPIPPPEAVKREQQLRRERQILCRDVTIKGRFVGRVAFQRHALPFKNPFMTDKGVKKIVLTVSPFAVYQRLGLFRLTNALSE